MILALLVFTGAHLRDEWRFFAPGALIGADGGAPVLQGDPNAPGVDAAFSAAAARLPTSITCVIGRDAWNRNYFRAAYLLMPRRVWPAMALPASGPVSGDEPVSAGALARAVRMYHAACVLTSAGERAPSGFLLITKGSYSLYLSPNLDGLPCATMRGCTGTIAGFRATRAATVAVVTSGRVPACGCGTLAEQMSLPGQKAGVSPAAGISLKAVGAWIGAGGAVSIARAAARGATR